VCAGRLIVRLLQVCADNLDNVLSGLGRGLRFTRHVVEDVILQQFAHQAINRAAGGGKALQHIGAMGILFKSMKDGFQLSDDLFGACDEIELFASQV
jgi:hypothetical protein